VEISTYKPPYQLVFEQVNTNRAYLFACVHAQAENIFCLDLCDVVRCDSSGLALLIEVKKLCVKLHKTFKIAHMSHEVWALVQFFGLDVVFEEP